MFHRIRSKFLISRVLFFTIDDTMPFTHFIYKNQVHLISDNSISVLPKTFEAIIFTPSLEFAASNEEATNKALTVDALDNAVRYSRISQASIDFLEELFLEHGKFPKVFPLHPLYRRVPQGFYFEVYTLPETYQKCIFYFTRDIELSPVGFQLLDDSTPENVCQFLANVSAQLPSSIDIFYYTDEPLKSVDMCLPISGTLNALTTSVFAKAATFEIEAFHVPAIAASRKTFRMRIIASLCIVLALGFFGYKGYEYHQMTKQTASFEAKIRAANAEKLQVERDFKKYAKYLPLYLSTKKQYIWKELFLEISTMLPEKTKVQSVKVSKVGSSMAWKYTIIVELPNFSTTYDLLRDNVRKSPLLRASTIDARYDNAMFTSSVSGILRK